MDDRERARRYEDRLDKTEAHVMSLLVIAENHTVQIGLMMKGFLGTAGLVLLSVIGSILVKVLKLHVVGG